VHYEAFVFDFDGVLADSVEVKTRAFAKLFEPHGPEVVLQVVQHHRHHGGMTRVEKFRHYYNEYLEKNLNDEEMADLCRRFSELVVDEVVAAPDKVVQTVTLLRHLSHTRRGNARDCSAQGYGRIFQRSIGGPS
jgi:beta-phosphoglucomutase-like phosphatase (HAD superfamily)